MKEYYITVEYRLTIKAQDELTATFAAVLLSPPPPKHIRGVESIYVNGSDIVAITLEKN